MTDHQRAFTQALRLGYLRAQVLAGCVASVLIAAFGPLHMWWFAVTLFGCACVAWVVLRGYGR